MKVATITQSIAKMHNQVDKISKYMDEIFALHPECEAPEFMKGDDLGKWNTMYRTRKQIFDYIQRIENAVQDFEHFYFTDLS